MGALQPAENIQDLSLSPSVADAYSEVRQYKDLLLLGDLSTLAEEGIAAEMIHAAPTLSSPAQAALMTSLLGLAMELTGSGPSGLALQVPGGQVMDKSEAEVGDYLALIGEIADTMAGANDRYQAAKSSGLQYMYADLNDIIDNY